LVILNGRDETIQLGFLTVQLGLECTDQVGNLNCEITDLIRNTNRMRHTCQGLCPRVGGIFQRPQYFLIPFQPHM
jgi:hypothetical protein